MKNSNKLLSLFLTIVLIVSAFPLITYGEENELINTIYLIADTDAFTYYHVGQEERTVTNQLINNVLSVDENYKDAYYLDKNNSGLGVYENETYRNTRNGNLITTEKDYKYIFAIQAESGYDFDSNSENITVYLNGNLVEPDHVFYNEYWDSYRLYLDIDYAPAAQPASIPIEYVYFDNMEKIRAGSTSPSTTTNNYESLYQISDYSWSCKEDLEFSTGDIFKGSSTYTLSITLTPNSGYEFLTDPETGKFIGKISSYSNYDSYSYKMNDNKLVIDYIYTTEEILNDIYINIDYNNWNKFKPGLNATEAEYQLLDGIAAIPSEYETKYFINKSNSRLLKFSDGALDNIEADELISNDLTYYINFSIWSENSVSFDPNSENITVYINGIIVTPYNLFYNSYWDLYEVTIELGKFFEASSTVDKTSIIKGDSITITANATGGNGDYTYSYIVYNKTTDSWYRLVDNSSSKTFTWVAGSTGTRVFYVDVKDGIGRTVRCEPLTINVDEPNKLKATALADKTDVSTGESVTFTASATGGTAPYTYSYIVYNQTTNQWARLADNVESNTFTWVAGSAGTRAFYVDVKDSKGTIVRCNALTVTTTENPKLKATASTNKTDVSIGESVTFTASAAGGFGDYTYSFIVYNETTDSWFRLVDNSSSNTFTWVAGSSGTRIFYVDVKDSKGTIVRCNALTVTTTDDTKLKATATASETDVAVGESITFTTSATGGTEDYTYSFIVYNETTNSWFRLVDNSSSNTFTWVAGSSGTRIFYVDVKDNTNTVIRSNAIKVIVN